MTFSGSLKRVSLLLGAALVLSWLTSSSAFAQGETVSASDYFPVDPNQLCKRIFSVTYGGTGSFTNQIVGRLTAPYVTQPLTRALYCGFGADLSLSAWYNDGRVVANILDGDHYPSIDGCTT